MRYHKFARPATTVNESDDSSEDGSGSVDDVPITKTTKKGKGIGKGQSNTQQVSVYFIFASVRMRVIYIFISACII